MAEEDQLTQLNQQISELRSRLSELEAKQSESTRPVTLRAIVEGTTASSGEAFFETLVQYFAEAMGAKYAFIGQFIESRSKIRTLAVWSNDTMAENFEYEIAGTPCQAVLEGEIKHYPDNVRQEFPKNVLLQALSVRSYLAIPLADSDGQVLGHLAIMDDKSMPESKRDLSIFHIFAARATAELKTQLTESALNETQVARQKMEAEVNYLRDELRQVQNCSNIIGSSTALAKILEQVDLVAGTDSTVLILGESGTGKELLASEIHLRSQRSKQPLIRVNCATLPEALIESELFGHEKGAFTGATQDRAGRFELADRATIFLDEIGELPLSGQARLLRVLQEGQFERVGGTKTLDVNVRVIAATNRDIRKMVDDGRFREDLFYRLNVVPITSPPLRERREDIPELVMHFVTRFSKSLGRLKQSVPDELVEQLCHYGWPGNIRELQNVIERAIILSTGNEISLPPGALPIATEASSSNGFATLAMNEKNHILAALNACNGVIAGPAGAAQLLDVHKNTLRSRIEKLGIHFPSQAKP